MMNTDADISLEPVKAEDLIALKRLGVPASTFARLISNMMAKGVIDRSGYFDPTPRGERFHAFGHQADMVFWHLPTGRVATLMGRAFALNEDHIDNAATYAFESNLNVYRDVLDWLRADCDGIVVINWAQAFDRLRHAPRIAVDERLLPTYRKWMRPRHIPALSVIPSRAMAAA